MLQTLFVLSFLFSNHVFANSAFDLSEAKTRCQTHFTQTPEVYASDFQWGYTLLEMGDRFEEIYQSGKRLNMHPFYNPSENQFYIYLDDKKHHPVKITPEFIQNVTDHIEVAIEKGFADYVFFPDMGHSHFYFDEQYWNDNYLDFDTSYKNHANLYEKMLADPQRKSLYHLAEQLKMTDEDKVLLEDDILVFKYWHRNFVGFNDNSRKYVIRIADESKGYNTVSNWKGHKSWSAGFAVSASKDGCFPYFDKDGKKRYFDIGLQDPRYAPSIKQEEVGY